MLSLTRRRAITTFGSPMNRNRKSRSWTSRCSSGRRPARSPFPRRNERASLVLLTLFLLPGLVHGAGPLTIVSAAISQIEDGAAAPSSATFAAGEMLFLSFQVDGYQVSPAQ